MSSLVSQPSRPGTENFWSIAFVAAPEVAMPTTVTTIQRAAIRRRCASTQRVKVAITRLYHKRFVARTMAAVTGGISRPPDALGHYTGFLLHWAGSRARETFARAMEDVDLRPQDFVVLTMIDAHPGMTQNELVLTTHTDPSSMVALVDHLETAGLAERRPHPSDRRKRTVH